MPNTLITPKKIDPKRYSIIDDDELRELAAKKAAEKANIVKPNEKGKEKEGNEQDLLLLDFPIELLLILINYLSVADILKLAQTCFMLRRLTSDNMLWEGLLNQHYPVRRVRAGINSPRVEFVNCDVERIRHYSKVGQAKKLPDKQFKLFVLGLTHLPDLLKRNEFLRLNATDLFVTDHQIPLTRGFSADQTLLNRLYEKLPPKQRQAAKKGLYTKITLTEEAQKERILAATVCNQLSTLESMLEAYKGKDKKRQIQVCQYYACALGFTDMLKYLLGKVPLTQYHEYNPHVPLSETAVRYQQNGALELLLKQKGIKLDSVAQDGESWHLHGAAFTNNLKAVTLLLDKGADLKQPDYNAISVLTKACAGKASWELVSTLLEKGADIAPYDEAEALKSDSQFNTQWRYFFKHKGALKQKKIVDKAVKVQFAPFDLAKWALKTFPKPEKQVQVVIENIFSLLQSFSRVVNVSQQKGAKDSEKLDRSSLKKLFELITLMNGYFRIDQKHYSKALSIILKWNQKGERTQKGFLSQYQAYKLAVADFFLTAFMMGEIEDLTAIINKQEFEVWTYVVHLAIEKLSHEDEVEQEDLSRYINELCDEGKPSGDDRTVAKTLIDRSEKKKLLTRYVEFGWKNKSDITKLYELYPSDSHINAIAEVAGRGDQQLAEFLMKLGPPPRRLYVGNPETYNIVHTLHAVFWKQHSAVNNENKDAKSENSNSANNNNLIQSKGSR